MPRPREPRNSVAPSPPEQAAPELRYTVERGLAGRPVEVVGRAASLRIARAIFDAAGAERRPGELVLRDGPKVLLRRDGGAP